MNIVDRRKWWYGLSLLALVPGVLALLLFGLRLGVDFTGGSVISVTSERSADELRTVAEAAGAENPIVTESGANAYQIRFGSEADIGPALRTSGVTITQSEQVGPSVSGDLTTNALISLAIVSVAITLYIAFAFRRVDKPLRFGIAAIVSLLHDALFVLGTFAILGRVSGVEIDAFIVTAVLTVIGFSVHDTIVVFDRIRENLLKKSGADFAKLVNDSINEVIGRSLNTSLSTVLVLLALFLFGGESTAIFILALLVGMVAGTYSSIFVAAPLLVSWENFKVKRAKAKPAKATKPKAKPSKTPKARVKKPRSK